MTHGHLRSVLACFLYLEFARQLLAGNGKHQAYENTVKEVNVFLEDKPFNPTEIYKFTRMLNGMLAKKPNTKSSRAATCCTHWKRVSGASLRRIPTLMPC
jgi:hypothetical protein